MQEKRSIGDVSGALRCDLSLPVCWTFDAMHDSNMLLLHRRYICATSMHARSRTQIMLPTGNQGFEIWIQRW